MDEDQITYIIRGCIYTVYKHLGAGLLESIYEEALVIELEKAELKVERQVDIAIIYDGVELKNSLRLDILVESKVIIELKSVKEIQDIHYKQILSYLKLSNLYVGLLVNFNVNDIFKGIHRVYNSKMI
ncbi:MAG: GxxExxY protein [Bacteroidales bacterium]